MHNISLIEMKKMHILYFWILWMISSSCQHPTGYTFELQSENRRIPSTPIMIDLPDQYARHTHFSLLNVETNREIPIQHYSQNQWVFILESPMEPNSQRTYRLTPVNKPSISPGVTLTQNEESLEISVGDKPVLNYYTAVQEPPAGSPEYYRKSGFIHPVYSPNGEILSNDFPKDHMHQHGVFLAMVNTTFQGEKVDFWNQQRETGTITHIEVIDTTSGPVYAGFTCRLQHLDLTQDTVAALDEVWQVNVYHSTEPFIWDITSTLTCSGSDTLFMNEYHYGGMAFRGTEQWFDPAYQANEDSMVNYLGPGQGGFMTSEGKTRVDGNHSRPTWVDMHGKVDGNMAGVCIMDHPNNYRFPQPVRIHPTMPYFCFAPMVLGAFELVPEEIYRSSYRFLVHQGSPDTSQIQMQYQAYSKMPEVKWID